MAKHMVMDAVSHGDLWELQIDAWFRAKHSRDGVEGRMRLELGPLAVVTGATLARDGVELEARRMDRSKATQRYLKLLPRRIDPLLVRPASLRTYVVRAFPVTWNMNTEAQMTVFRFDPQPPGMLKLYTQGSRCLAVIPRYTFSDYQVPEGRPWRYRADPKAQRGYLFLPTADAREAFPVSPSYEVPCVADLERRLLSEKQHAWLAAPKPD